MFLENLNTMDEKKESFEKLVRENKDTIYTVCYMFSKDQDEVADLYQETLINLWKGLPQLKAEGNVKGWVYRVSLNTCISLDRKKKARPTEYLLTGADPTYIDIVVPRRKSVMHANAHYELPKAKPHYEL